MFALAFVASMPRLALGRVMKSCHRCIHPAVSASSCVRSLTIPTLLACLLACACQPALADEPTTAPTLSERNSRFIFLPPIDDGGKSSGPHPVTICLPPGYESTDTRYPVIYVLDGEAAFFTKGHGMRHAVGYEVVHDQLVHEGLIHPAIFVAVHNSVDASGKPIPGGRGTDYCVTGQTYKRGDVEQFHTTKAEGYYEYLAQTIKPLIDKTYRTRPEPASTGVTGFSAGGGGSFWMTYMHPETFGMGICQSPPFWGVWAGKELQALMADPKRPVPAVRLWLDAGSREFDFIYKDAYAAYRTPLAQGFRQGENIAFYTGHAHGHEKFDCNRRMRSALYFMLGTKPRKLTGVEITDMDAVEGGPIRLARPAHAVLETVYDGWLRLTDGSAQFKIGDSSLVSFDETRYELRPLAAGTTTITSSYAGRPISQQVEVPAPEAPMACPATTRPVVVDGDLADWPELPYKVDAPLSSDDVQLWTGAADLSYRFACTHDDQFLYIAVQTTDDYMSSDPDKDPWVQDGIEVRIDARPAAKQLGDTASKESPDILLVAMSPAKAGETRDPYKSDNLPEGTKAICKATPTGHNTEIAIPFAYLNEKAGKPWTDVRINIVVDDVDKDPKDFRGDKLWWRPDWRGPSNTWGSGTFRRQR